METQRSESESEEFEEQNLNGLDELLIDTKIIQVSTVEPNPQCIPYLPKHLFIQPSTVPEAQFGVWSISKLAKDYSFGPYEGAIVCDPEDAENSACWEVSKNGQVDHYLVAKDEIKTNWLRYINYTCDKEKQNIIAFQCNGLIYYRTIKNIPPQTELLLCYADIIEYRKTATLNASLLENCNFNENKSSEETNIQWLYDNEVNDEKKSNKDESVLPNQDLCKTEFSTNELFKKCSRGKGFICNVCNKIFGRINAITIHIRVHTGEKPYECTLCKRKFTQKQHLYGHMLTHTGEGPHECDICKRRFMQRSHVRAHMLIHTGETPFMCDICNRKFKRFSHLRRHEQTHTSKRIHGCTKCNRAFTQIEYLLEHQKIHTGDRPFHCDLCDKKFVRNDHLVKHRRIHTRGKPFECDLCDKRFTRKSNLDRHRIVHFR